MNWNETKWKNWCTGEGAPAVTDFDNFIENRNLERAVERLCAARQFFTGTEDTAFLEQLKHAVVMIDNAAAMESEFHGEDARCADVVSEAPEDDFGFEEPEGLFDDFAQFEWDQRLTLSMDEIPSEEKTAKDFLEYLAFESLIFAHDNSEYGIPWCFNGCEEKLSEICSQLGITLPPTPAADDWQGQFTRYYKICEAFFHWRRAHMMSPARLWTLLYVFMAQ